MSFSRNLNMPAAAPRSPFEPAPLRRPRTGSLLPLIMVALCLLAAASAAVAALEDLRGMLFLGGGVALVGFTMLSVMAPEAALAGLLLVAYVSAGLARYIPGPTGLSVDFALLALMIGVFLRQGGRTEWHFFRSASFFGIGGWALLCTLELLNPDVASRVAWIYAVRGLALYWLGGFPVIMALLTPARRSGGEDESEADARRDVRVVRQLITWILILSAAGALWGIKQNVLGLDSWEQAWVSQPQNQSTHVLAGRLRVFSFYSDTAQFAVNMACSALIAVVLAFAVRRPAHRVLLLALAALLFTGLMLSGTRSAYIAFAAGFAVFLVVRRSFRTLLVGGLMLAGVIGILRFTWAGQSIYAVQRMREAVTPFSDPSFLVRLENQKRLASWLVEHPFGGGVGSAGYWGLRFSPGTFLADLPLDSWYVRIAAETGFPGLLFYVGMVLGLGIRAVVVTWRETDPERRRYLEPLVSVWWGVVLASYANQYLGQIPTGFVMLTALCAVEAAAQRQRTGDSRLRLSSL